MASRSWLSVFSFLCGSAVSFPLYSQLFNIISGEWGDPQPILHNELHDKGRKHLEREMGFNTGASWRAGENADRAEQLLL